MHSRNGQGGNWKMRFAQWFEGRYGMDELSQTLIIVGCVLVVINFIFSISFVSFLSLIAFIWAFFRVYSKNYEARTRELVRYQELMRNPKEGWRITSRRWQNRKTTMYFKCKGCGTMLNIPRGKGKLLVTCPKCGTKVEKKS